MRPPWNGRHRHHPGTVISLRRRWLIAALTNTACRVAEEITPCKTSRSKRATCPQRILRANRSCAHKEMEIPYTVSARRDTGLWNAKVGIWLFLASEVMLFGGLFSGYIFLRLDAGPGDWPHGLLNVPVGPGNTAILIAS